jgi:hypothetical protein
MTGTIIRTIAEISKFTGMTGLVERVRDHFDDRGRVP